MAVIFKNWQYSLPMFPWIVKTDLFTRSFVFTESCRYNLQGKDQQDWNKLTGFTFGLSFKNAVHKNSLRIAWRYNIAEGVIELCWYAYKNGVRMYAEKDIWKAKIGEPVKIIIFKETIGFGSYAVLINRVKKKVDPHYDEDSRYGWLCYPYFGGTSKAPQKITIKKITY